MKLALWQTVGFPENTRESLDALELTARAAAAQGAALLLCPECWLCGYNIGAAAASLAESPDGPAATRIADIARRSDITIAYGYAERGDRDGQVYNSVQVIGTQGRPLSHYRKTHLFGSAERAVFRPGNGFTAPFALGKLRIGLLICYDVEFPEAVRALALMGADLVLVPTAVTEGYGVVPRTLVPARAAENQLFVAWCNRTGEERGMRFLGHSCVNGPDGADLISMGPSERLAVVDIEPSSRATAQSAYHYLADRRPEIYAPPPTPID